MESSRRADGGRGDGVGLDDSRMRRFAQKSCREAEDRSESRIRDYCSMIVPYIERRMFFRKGRFKSRSPSIVAQATRLCLRVYQIPTIHELDIGQSL